MNCRLKRVDPFWLKNPALPAVAIVAGAVGLFAARSGRAVIAIVAATVCGVAVFFATKPALSGVFAVFGLIGGVVTFIAAPNSGLSPLMRALATVGFSLLYMVLMDGVVLMVSMIYNMFTCVGCVGLSLRLEE